MTQIRGVVPSPADFPAGCRFADRCPAVTEVCATEVPVVAAPGSHHVAACHHPALTRDVAQDVAKDVARDVAQESEATP
jgi:peptide/nickel transport system permease protein